MAAFVLLEAWSTLRGEWRCVWKEGGVVCVAQVGTTRMPLLYADNWVTLQQVCDCCRLSIIFVLDLVWYSIMYHRFLRYVVCMHI